MARAPAPEHGPASAETPPGRAREPGAPPTFASESPASRAPSDLDASPPWSVRRDRDRHSQVVSNSQPLATNSRELRSEKSGTLHYGLIARRERGRVARLASGASRRVTATLAGGGQPEAERGWRDRAAEPDRGAGSPGAAGDAGDAWSAVARRRPRRARVVHVEVVHLLRAGIAVDACLCGLPRRGGGR